MVSTFTLSGVLLGSDNLPLRSRKVVATPRPANVIIVSGQSVSLDSSAYTDASGAFTMIVIKNAGTVYSIQTKPERRLPAGIELRCDDWPASSVLTLDQLPRAIPPGVILGQTVEELTATLQAYIDANTQIGIPFSDTRVTLTVGVGDMGYPNATGRAMSIVGVMAHAGISPTGASLILNVRNNGTSIFTNPAHRPTILTGTSNGAASVIDHGAYAPGDVLTVDIDQVGSTAPGGHLTVNVVMQG